MLFSLVFSSANRAIPHRTYRPGGIGANNGAAPMKKIRCRVKRYEKRGVQRRFYDWATPKRTQSRTSSQVFALEPARRALTRPDGTPGRLSGKPFDTLVYLVETRGRARRPRRAAARRLAEARYRRQQPQPSHRDAAPHPRRAARRDRRRPRLSVRDAGAPSAATERRGRRFEALRARAPQRRQRSLELTLRPAARSATRGRSRWPIFVAAAAAGRGRGRAARADSRRRPQRSSLVGTRIDVGNRSPDIRARSSRRRCLRTERASRFRGDGPAGGRDLYLTQVGVAEPFRVTDAVGEPTTESRLVAGRHADRVPAASRSGAVRRHGDAGPRRRCAAAVTKDACMQFPWTARRSSRGVPDGQQLLFTTLRDRTRGRRTTTACTG